MQYGYADFNHNLKYGYFHFPRGRKMPIGQQNSFYDDESYLTYIYGKRWNLQNYVPLFLHKLDLLHVNGLLKI